MCGGQLVIESLRDMNVEHESFGEIQRKQKQLNKTVESLEDRSRASGIRLKRPLI